MALAMAVEKIVFAVDFAPIEAVQFRNMPDSYLPDTYEPDSYRADADDFDADVFDAGPYPAGDPSAFLSFNHADVVLTLQVQRMSTEISLIEALGGGWSTAQLPTS